MAAGRVYRTSTVQYLQRPVQNREDVNPLLTVEIASPLDVSYGSGTPITRARAVRDRMRPWPYLVNRQTRPRIDQSASGTDATATPSTINVPSVFTAMAGTVDDTTIPSTIAVPTTFGAPTISAGTTPTPARINVLTTFGTPSLPGSTSATATPTTIAVTTSFGSVAPAASAPNYTFTPPTVNDRPLGYDRRAPGRVFTHFASQPRGRNVWKLTNGTYTYDQPIDESTIAVTYHGGHQHPVTSAEAAALTAAGFGANIA